MAKTVKMCDMSGEIAAIVFQKLNSKDVILGEVKGTSELIIATDVEPAELVYPEGWYYAKGCFRNKHTSSTGAYEEIRMVKVDGTSWKELANYSTLDN